MLVQELADLLGRQGPHETVDRLAAGEHHAKGDGAHAEGLAELAGDLGLFVAVELGEDEATAVLGLQLLQHRAELLARAAPGGPDVEQHRGVHAGGQQIGLEILERDVDHVQWCPAARSQRSPHRGVARDNGTGGMWMAGERGHLKFKASQHRTAQERQ
jgi:hypothetical protein